jgi:hypothetical protein
MKLNSTVDSDLSEIQEVGADGLPDLSPRT